MIHEFKFKSILHAGVSLIALGFISSTPDLSQALELGPYEMSGKVKSYTEKIVTLENDQAILEIPRHSVGVKKLKTGETIHLALSSDQAREVKSKPKKPKKK